MKYFELSTTVYLQNNLHYLELHDKLSRFINEAFNDKDELSKKHFDKGYKHYCFDLLYNPSIAIKKGVYQKENSYKFRMRSPDKEFLESLQNRLSEVKNPNFTYIASQMRTIKQFFVQSITSITPTIVSVDKEGQKQPIQWTIEKDGDILKLQKQLHENLLKKYESFYGEKLDDIQNFIQLLEIKNHKPQTIRIEKNGKKIRIFGNKFMIVPNEDEVSQKLAFLALSCGLGEKNSLGGGFCVGRMG